MSDTDIYKSRERLPYGDKRPRRSTRRRTSDPQRSFDDHERKRRSKNSGLRRLLHLYRKKENEKVVWLSILICTGTVLVVLAIWQFWIREALYRAQNDQVQYTRPQTHLSDTPESAAE